MITRVLLLCNDRIVSYLFILSEQLHTCIISGLSLQIKSINKLCRSVQNAL